MSQAPADLQAFLRQLQQSGQTPAGSEGAQPAASQWAYLAYVMQQQAQQQQQQQSRPAPPDIAGMLAQAMSADPAAAQNLAPFLTAMMAKTAEGSGAEGKSPAQEGAEAPGPALSSEALGNTKLEGMLDASSILPLLQLQCAPCF